jgi:hypothetical protein
MRLTVVARAALALGAGLLFPSAGPAQITLGQNDTFETSTTLNWTDGHGGTGESVQAGGPAGLSDHYLQVISTGGGGAGSKMTVFNRNQWVGNYIAAGVNDIDLSLFAPSGGTALSIRLAFKSSTANGTPGYVSTVPFALPADGAWHHTDFQLTAVAMTAIGSPTAFGTFFSTPGPVEMRIISSVNPSLDGDAIAATLGVDNIHAGFTPTPEPGGTLAVVLAAAGVAGPLVRRCRRGRV